MDLNSDLSNVSVAAGKQNIEALFSRFPSYMYCCNLEILLMLVRYIRAMLPYLQLANIQAP